MKKQQQNFLGVWLVYFQMLYTFLSDIRLNYEKFTGPEPILFIENVFICSF